MSTAIAIRQGPFGRVALLDIDRPVVAHAHPHCHVLFKIDGADSEFRVRDRLYPLAAGTAVAVNSWAPHAYPHPAELPRSLVLALYVEPAWLARLDRVFALSGRPEFFRAPCFDVPTSVRRRAAAMAEALLGDAPPAASEALLLELMIAVIDNASEWRRLNAARHSISRARDFRVLDFRVRRALDHLGARVGEHVPSEELARAAGLSRAHLFALFAHDTGLTPRLYANVLRMEHAYRRLADSAGTIVLLARELGFAAPPHFTRFFRDHLGVSPSAYRRFVAAQGA